MNRLKVSGLAVLILTVGYQSLLLAESPAAVEPRDALVLVTVRSFMGRFAGGGFVIGDGTLVVTAYHLVFEQSKQGRHEMAGMVFAASPSQADVPTRQSRSTPKLSDFFRKEVPSEVSSPICWRRPVDLTSPRCISASF